MSHNRIPDDERVLAGAGMLLVAFAYVTSNHYLQIRWNTAVALPVLWGPIGLAAGLAGVPLLFAGAGLAAARAPDRSWTGLLGRFVLPCLVLHVLTVIGTAWVLRRFASSFAPVALHDLAEIRAALLLPPPVLAIPYTLALVAVTAHLSRTLPAPAVLAVAGAGAIAGAWQGAAFLPAALLYFLIGQRLLPARPRTGSGLPVVAAAGLVVAGAAVTLAGRPVTPLVALLAGLAAIPSGVLLAGAVRSWRPAGYPLRAVGALLILAGAVLVPATAVLDHVALPRISVAAGAVQTVIAAVGPPLITAAFAGAAALVHAALSRAGRPA